MKTLTIVVRCALLIALMGCTINIFTLRRSAPHYTGVDLAAAPLVNEWLKLAKEHDIKFDNEVSIGFTKIPENRTVGLTSYGLGGFREIDIDLPYWEASTLTARKILLFHELTHAYCDREHDFNDGEEYEKGEDQKKGLYKDGCPLSIMYPFIISDSCFMGHYDEYINEMFNRCEPF